MISFDEHQEQTLREKQPGVRNRTFSCLLTGLTLFGLLLVFGLGLGLPNTYWLAISDIQAFENDNSIVVFVEVQRDMRKGGYIQQPPIRKTMQLIRLDISGDGQVRQVSLKSGKKLTFNTNIAPIIRLEDGFYLVQQPSMGNPDCQIHRVAGDSIESLGFEECQEILRSTGLPCGEVCQIDDFSRLDAISARQGWRRLNNMSHFFGGNLTIASNRHSIQLRLIGDPQKDSIIAERLAGPIPWSKPIFTVDSTRWKSYKSPLE